MRTLKYFKIDVDDQLIEKPILFYSVEYPTIFQCGNYLIENLHFKGFHLYETNPNAIINKGDYYIANYSNGEIILKKSKERNGFWNEFYTKDINIVYSKVIRATHPIAGGDIYVDECYEIIKKSELL